MGTIRRAELDGAVRGGILSAEQADRLLAFLEGDATVPSAGTGPRFSFVHVLYYLGGMIAIGAMSIFMTLGWNALGGWGGFATAALYAVLALLLTHWFLEAKHLEIPAGITATLAVVMVPLAIFGAQMALGYWTDTKNYRDYHVFIDWRWLMMEFGTLAVGAILLWRYRFPFMLMPIAVTLWYMSMDLVPFLFGQERVYDWEIRKFISVWFGLSMTLVAFWVDLRSRFSRDYAFWLYLFGVLTFWGGLSLMNSGSELGKLAYCGINVAMILLGAVIGRRVFAVFGGLGVAGYLGYLSYKVFKDSMIFPLALSLVGLAIIGLGVLWQRREAQWSARLRGFLPGPLRELIEARAVR
jgi:Ca2+/Na+ antiporter